MKKLDIKNNFQGAYSVAETQSAANKESVRTLTPLTPYGHNKPADRGRPLCPGVRKQEDVCAGSTPGAPSIEEEKPQSVDENVKKVKQQSLEDTAEAVLRKALRGLDRRVSGFSVKETKIIYEYDDDGNRGIKNETVVTKKILPEMSAIIFTLTNLDGKRWKNKPDATAENPFTTEEDTVDLSQVPEDILKMLQGTAFSKQEE